MSSFWSILFLSLLGSVVALIGGVIFLLKKSWSAALEENSVPFAAGVLLSVALVGLLPEAVDLVGENAFLYVLLAFTGTFLFEQFFLMIHHHSGEDGCKRCLTAAPLVIIGDTIHNFVDGVAIAATFLTSPGLGTVTALSTFLHEFPHEIGDFGVLLRAGWSRWRVFLVNFVSALATLVGALLIYFFYVPSIMGVLLSISAGMFLYLGASDFLPSIGEGKNRNRQLLAFIVGVLVMVLSLRAVPEEHQAQPEAKEISSQLTSNSC